MRNLLRQGRNGLFNGFSGPKTEESRVDKKIELVPTSYVYTEMTTPSYPPLGSMSVGVGCDLDSPPVSTLSGGFKRTVCSPTSCPVWHFVDCTFREEVVGPRVLVNDRGRVTVRE